MQKMISWVAVGAFVVAMGPWGSRAALAGESDRPVAAELRVQPGAMRAHPVLTMIGTASWYSEEDPGINPRTANGEAFDDQQLTCAIWNLPFNTALHVTNLNTGDAVVVRVNDRGPARRLVAEGRVVDLSLAAFRRIAKPEKGLITVRVELFDE